MRAEDVVRQGFDEIQHINQVFLNFFVTPTDDTRTLARFSIVAEHAHELDLDAPVVRAFIALLRRGPTVIDPTLTVFEGQFVQRQGDWTRATPPSPTTCPPRSSGASAPTR